MTSDHPIEPFSAQMAIGLSIGPPQVGGLLLGDPEMELRFSVHCEQRYQLGMRIPIALRLGMKISSTTPQPWANDSHMYIGVVELKVISISGHLKSGDVIGWILG